MMVEKRDKTKRFSDCNFFPKNSNGQLTIFIIVAVAVVGISAVVFFMNGNFSIFNPESSNVNNFVQNCLQDASNKIVYASAYGGGYLVPPNLSDNLGFPYYYSDGKNYMPSKEKIENEMSDNFGKISSLCIRNFEDFKNLEITHEELSAKSSIMDDKVVFEINYPIKITNGQSSSLLKNFRTETKVRYEIVYKAAEDFMKEQINHDGICLNCALDVALKNDLYLDMQNEGNGTIFSFRDENSKINNETLQFVFINKY